MKLMTKLNQRSKSVNANSISLLHHHGVDRSSISSLTSVSNDKCSSAKERVKNDADNLPPNFSRQSSSNSSTPHARSSLFETARKMDRDLLLAMVEVAAVADEHEDDEHDLDRDIYGLAYNSDYYDDNDDDDDCCSIASELRRLDTIESSVRDELNQIENIWRFSERSCMSSQPYQDEHNYSHHDRSSQNFDGSFVDSLEDDSPELLSVSTGSTSSAPSSPVSWSSALQNESNDDDGNNMTDTFMPVPPPFLHPSIQQSNLSLALASDILATRLYQSRSNIIPIWLQKVFPQPSVQAFFRSDNNNNTNNNNNSAETNWLLGVPLIGSAANNSGQVILMTNGNVNNNHTRFVNVPKSVLEGFTRMDHNDDLVSYGEID